MRDSCNKLHGCALRHCHFFKLAHAVTRNEGFAVMGSSFAQAQPYPQLRVGPSTSTLRSKRLGCSRWPASPVPAVAATLSSSLSTFFHPIRVHEKRQRQEDAHVRLNVRSTSNSVITLVALAQRACWTDSGRHRHHEYLSHLR